MFIFTLSTEQAAAARPMSALSSAQLSSAAQRAVLASRWRQQTRQPPAPGTALELGTNIRKVSQLRKRPLLELAHLRIYARQTLIHKDHKDSASHKL